MDRERRESYAVSGTAISVLIAAPFFGWLADVKLGNYRVTKMGITFSLMASAIVSLFSLIDYNTSLRSEQNNLVRTILIVGISLYYWTATVITLVASNSFQLSLEQMPDASACREHY